jgi:hypothetical protein
MNSNIPFHGGTALSRVWHAGNEQPLQHDFAHVLPSNALPLLQWLHLKLVSKMHDRCHTLCFLAGFPSDTFWCPGHVPGSRLAKLCITSTQAHDDLSRAGKRVRFMPRCPAASQQLWPMNKKAYRRRRYAHIAEHGNQLWISHG